MSHFENPLTNLDLWCEWTGDPNDAVEVGFAVNVSIHTTTYPSDLLYHIHVPSD